MSRPSLRTFIAAATAVVAALPPLGAAAQTPGGLGSAVVTPVLWSIGAILVGVLVFGILYLFKRQLGLFDHLDWIAPIGPVYSRDLPSEEDEGHEAGAGGHGHG